MFNCIPAFKQLFLNNGMFFQCRNKVEVTLYVENDCLLFDSRTPFSTSHTMCTDLAAVFAAGLAEAVLEGACTILTRMPPACQPVALNALLWYAGFDVFTVTPTCPPSVPHAYSKDLAFDAAVGFVPPSIAFAISAYSTLELTRPLRWSASGRTDSSSSAGSSHS